MKRDITSESFFGRIMTALTLLILCTVIFAIVGIYFACADVEIDSFLMIVLPIYGAAVVMLLPHLIYNLVLYKHFKKLLKSSKVLYDNLDEVTDPSFYASIFLGGHRVVIDGHYSRSIYSYHAVNKLTNKWVEYILDGETVYLLNSAED